MGVCGHGRDRLDELRVPAILKTLQSQEVVVVEQSCQYQSKKATKVMIVRLEGIAFRYCKGRADHLDFGNNHGYDKKVFVF